MSGFRSLISADDALKRLLAHVDLTPQPSIAMPLEETLGMVCADDIHSPVDVPPYDRSAVDGYAVIADETLGASPTNPIELKLAGSVKAGENPLSVKRIRRGFAVEVYTGAPLPEGADAVVMAEHAVKKDGAVEITKPVASLQNVSRRGEDFSKGELVIRRGTRIRPWHIGALASLNITKIRVYEPMRVAVLSTGDELIELGDAQTPGKVVNSSKPMLKALIREHGCEPIDLGTVGDDIDTIAERASQGLKKARMLLITGGTSVGSGDLVPEAVARLGRPGIIFHGVRIRPAKPTGAAIIDGKAVILLSGFPVSALIGFQLFAAPIIEKIYNSPSGLPRRVRGKLTRRVANPVETTSFIRVKVIEKDGEYLVEPLMLTGSGLLSTLTKANGILVVSEGVEGFDEGEEVEVELL